MAYFIVLVVLSIATIDMNKRLKNRNMEAFNQECKKLQKLIK